MHHRNRQKQKPSRRTIVIVMASFTTCIVIGLAVFFHLLRVDKSAAATKEVFINEQEFTVDMALPAPVVSGGVGGSSGANTQLIRKAKEIHSANPTSN